MLAGGGREQGRAVVPQELRDGRLGLPRISVSGGEGGGVCGRGGRGAAAVREEAEAEVERGAGSVACCGFGERDEERERVTGAWVRGSFPFFYPFLIFRAWVGAFVFLLNDSWTLDLDQGLDRWLICGSWLPLF